MTTALVNQVGLDVTIADEVVHVALVAEQGPPGGSGSSWSAVFEYVIDGDRIVQQVVEWVNGTGIKPPVGSYVGVDGTLVTDIELAEEYEIPPADTIDGGFF